MLYEKDLPIKKHKKITARVGDFSKGFDYDMDVSKSCISPKLSYNFHFENGALVSGCGVRDIRLAEEETDQEFRRILNNPYSVKFLGAWLYNYYNETYNKFQKKVVLYGDDNNIYYFRLLGFDNLIYKLYDESLNSLPEAIHYNINNKDLMLFSSKDDNLLVWHSDSDPYVVNDVPKFRSICMHNSRLFAIVEGPGNKILYSDNTDPTSWPGVVDSTIGVIEFPDEQRGKPNKILSFLDDLYVIRDFGISKITYFSKTNSYQITQLFISGGNIYKDTVCVCNDKIYMLASDGVYVFDGNDTVKLDLKINKLFSRFNTNSKACFFEGKYYVACRLDYENKFVLGDEGVNNSLIAIDVLSGEISITRGIDIAWLLPITEGCFSKLLVCLNGENGDRVCELSKDGLFFDDVLPKFWEIHFSDMGVLKNTKLIRQIYIDSESDCVLMVKCDDFEKEYFVEGSLKQNRINIMKKADKFSLVIKSSVDINKIKALEVVYDLV